MKKKRKKRL